MRRSTMLTGLLATTLALSACGGGDQLAGGDGGEQGGGSLVVGGANFTEMAIMEAMYAALLEDAGYDVTVTATGERATYGGAVISGEVDVIPEYAAAMADYLSAEAGGDAVSTADVEGTMEALVPLAEDAGLTVLEPAEAANDNAFYITQERADADGVATLTELSESLDGPVELAAGEECLSEDSQPFCGPALIGVYGFEISGVTGDGFGSITGKQKVVDGQVPMGITGTTDATLDALGLVLLEDDQDVQPANNLVPVVNTESAGDPAIAEALNQLAPVLTTEDLSELNLQVDEQRLLAEDVARDYLVEQGLIEG